MQISYKPLLIAIVILVIVFVFLKFYISSPTEIKEKAKVTINNQTFIVEVAKTVVNRAKGLSGRSALGFNQGMLFIFSEPGSYGFWMLGMKFPIDILWISGDEIVGITENIDPQIGAGLTDLKTYYPPQPVERALEINAGLSKQRGFRVGDKISFQDF